MRVLRPRGGKCPRCIESKSGAGQRTPGRKDPRAKPQKNHVVGKILLAISPSRETLIKEDTCNLEQPEAYMFSASTAPKQPDRTRLAKILGMLGSNFDNEALVAARAATAWLQKHNTNWTDLLCYQPAYGAPVDTGFGVPPYDRPGPSPAPSSEDASIQSIVEPWDLPDYVSGVARVVDDTPCRSGPMVHVEIVDVQNCNFFGRSETVFRGIRLFDSDAIAAARTGERIHLRIRKPRKLHHHPVGSLAR